MSKKQKELFCVSVKTEAGDEYLFISESNKKTKDMAKIIWEAEGKCESLEFYLSTLRVKVEKCQVIP